MGIVSGIEASLTLSPTDAGGKVNSIRHGYRGAMLVFPEWEETWADGGRRLSAAAIVGLLDATEVLPGTTSVVRFYFIYPDTDEGVDLSPGVAFRVWEGRFVGAGTILRALHDPWPG